jgi:hypothetical protein
MVALGSDKITALGSDQLNNLTTAELVALTTSQISNGLTTTQLVTLDAATCQRLEHAAAGLTAWAWASPP